MNEKECSHIAMSNMQNICCYMADIETYELIYINNTAKNLLNIADTEYIGRKCYEVLHGKSDVCSFCTNNKLVPGEFSKREHFNPEVNKQFELNKTLIEVCGKPVVFEFAIDITDTSNKFVQLKKQLTKEETLVKCAQTLSVHKEMPVAIDTLLTMICQFYDGDRAYIFENCDDGIHMDNTYEWNEEGIEPQLGILQNIPIDFVRSWYDHFESEGEFFITSLEIDVSRDANVYALLEVQGIESLIAAPLVINGEIIGFMGVDNPKRGTTDISLIRSVALFITNDLDKKKILHQIEKNGYIDNFTGLYNRNKYIKMVEEIIECNSRSIGIVYLDINGLKRANDESGHEYGDKLILTLVELMRTYFPYDLFRIGGDEFIGLYKDNDHAEFDNKVYKLGEILKAQPELSVSMGASWCSEGVNIANSISRADKLMYINKQGYYKAKQAKNIRAANYSILGENFGIEKNANTQTDLLTGCLDKDSAEKIINNILDCSIEADKHLLILVDIDNFKTVNETFGIAFGDKVLSNIGVQLREWLREGDVIGRIGGDEFIILLRNISDYSAIKQKAEDIAFVYRKELLTIHEKHNMSCSLGISRFRHDGKTFKELYEKAFIALDSAKKNNKDQACIFTADISSNVTRKITEIENNLKFSKQDFEKNILLRAFKLLQLTDDVSNAINAVLKMIGEEFNISRSYVFELSEDGNHYCNTYEWCASGVSAEIDTLQKVPIDEYSYVISLAGDDGVLACNNINNIEGNYRNILESQGVKSFLNGFVVIHNNPQLMLGIDDCAQRRVWTEVEIVSMRYLSNLLGMFSTKLDNINLTLEFNKIKSLLETDKLTGISTKEKFYLNTREMLKGHPEKKFFFMLINVNKFQLINSFYGMAEGDRLLKAIAHDLDMLGKQTLSTCGRVGPDIFCECQEITAPLESMLDAILERIKTIITNYRPDYSLHFSIGIYEIKSMDTPLEVMYSKATMAAKKIKHVQSTMYLIYEDGMEEDNLREQSIINDIYPALIDNQLEVYLQPKISLFSYEVVGAEALVRWNHPIKGQIAPNDFIPILEKNGLIIKVDYFVWETVFSFLREQKVNNRILIPISINVSKVDLFNKNIIAYFEHFLKKYEVDPKYVHIEITETAYIENHKEIIDVIHALKQLGFDIEMDDFGTGYSSLNMFSDMIVDTLKLDMNFLRNLQSSGDKLNILSFIISLARNFGLPVVAEGIETEEQLNFLKIIGCDIGQGYFFAKPMPMNDFVIYLREKQLTKPLIQADKIISQIERQDILYPDQKVNEFFNFALGAAGIFEIKGEDIKMIRCNDEYYDIIGVKNHKLLFKNNITDVFHKDDIATAFMKVQEAKVIKKTVSCDIRVLDFSVISDRDDQKYNYIHVRFKLINSTSKADLYLATFERL